MADESDDPRYLRAWRRYVVRLAAWIAAWLVFPVLLAHGAGATAFLAWVAGAGAAAFWLVRWRCPRCGQTFVVAAVANPLARRCMHCGLPKWSRAAPPPPPAQEHTWEGRAPDLEAEVRFLASAHGGRSEPVRTGYRAQLRYDDQDGEAVYAFPESARVQPGDTATARLWLLAPEAHRGKLVPGKSFQIREGRKVVAIGVVWRVLALDGGPSAATGGA